jgi:RHS repeat-associated protein
MVNFTYWPVTATARNLLASVIQPVEAPKADSVYYDFLGNDSSSVSPLGIRVRIHRDSIGRILTLVTPIDSSHSRTDSTQYDNMSRVIFTSSHAPALTHNFRTDSVLLGHIFVVDQPFTADSAILTTATTYDTAGDPLTIRRNSLPDIASIGTMRTDFVYDAVGRTVKQIQHFGSPDSTAYDSTLYDAAGNSIVVVTRRLDTIRTRYDALNRRVQRTLPLKEYARDTTLAFILLGHETLAPVPDYPNCPDGTGYCIPADTATFGYDRVGNLTLANNGDAQITRAYNQNGTLAVDTLRIRAYNGGDFSQHVYGLSYTYDLDGRRLTLNHPSNIAPVNSSHVVLGQQTYIYDLQGIGELTDVTDVFGNDFNYEYDLDSRVIHTGTEGVAGHRFYDADSRLQERIDSTTNVSPTNGWQYNHFHDDIYSYDLRGKVIGMSDTARAEQLEVLNAYSGLGSLVDNLIRPLNDPGGSSDRTEEFDVTDAFGNFFWRWNDSWMGINHADSAQSIIQPVYEVGSGRLLRYGPDDSSGFVPYVNVVHMLYDSSGNVRLESDARTSSTVQYLAIGRIYDALQQLRAFDKQECFGSGGSDTTCQFNPQSVSDIPYFSEYRYDALGRRVFARSHPVRSCLGEFRTLFGCQGFVERTVYDGDQVLYEIRMPDSVGIAMPALEIDTGGVASYEGTQWQYGRVTYTHGLGLDDPVDIVRVGYDTLFPGPEQIIPLADWRGGYDAGTLALGAQYLPDSATFFNNPTLSFRVKYADLQYGAYHQDRFFSTPAQLSIWNGSLIADRRDPTNQLYLRNRYFDPQTGRFTQEDPIGLAGGLNAYGFAAGDPVNYSDPFGLCPPEQVCGVAAVLAAAWQSIADRVENAVSRLGASLSSGERDYTAGADYVEDHATIGVSASYANASVSAEVSKAEGGSTNESVVLNTPQAGASVDVGVKGEAPAGAQTGSVDIGVSKHLGVSVNGYRDSAHKFHANGATVHIGVGVPDAAPIGGTIDLKPAGPPQ